MSKTADRLILRPVSQDSPDSASTGETTCRKMSKVFAPRDTKPDSARELTNIIPSSLDPRKGRKPQNVLHQTRQAQNKPGSEIGIGDYRSRLFHEEPHA